jgi:hypothetical protein
MKTPKAPSPEATAAAQTQMNKATATTQQELNMVNQNTPYGSLSYEQTGTSASGTPQYTATQTLSPENQALYDQYMSLSGKLGGIGNTQADNVAGTMGQPFNFEASQAKKLTDIQDTFLNPQWDRQQAALETQLTNQGVNPGTEAYTRAMQEHSQNRQSAYDQNYLSAYGTTANQALTERNQPLNEMMAMLSGSQVQQPGYTNTPQSQVSGVDYAGLVNQNYQNQLASHNAKMGGIFDIASAAAGGWAMSDRRLKKHIRPVGKLDNGLNVYAYRMKGSDAPQLGLMADEVERINPEAVREIGGFKAVNYDLAVQ